MNDFLAKTAELQADLDGWVDFLELPVKTFEDAGLEGIAQQIDESISFENSTFADLIATEVENVPKSAIKALCLGAAYLRAAISDYANKGSSAIWLLMAASEQFYFCRGMATGVLYEDSIKRAALSVHGKKGATSRHKAGTELKAWALAQAIESRSADKDTARMLVNKMPTNLGNGLNNPERLIYETLLAKNKAK